MQNVFWGFIPLPLTTYLLHVVEHVEMHLHINSHMHSVRSFRDKTTWWVWVLRICMNPAVAIEMIPFVELMLFVGKRRMQRWSTNDTWSCPVVIRSQMEPREFIYIQDQIINVINTCYSACQSPAEGSQVPLSCQHNEPETTCSSTRIFQAYN